MSIPTVFVADFWTNEPFDSEQLMISLKIVEITRIELKDGVLKLTGISDLPIIKIAEVPLKKLLPGYRGIKFLGDNHPPSENVPLEKHWHN